MNLIISFLLVFSCNYTCLPVYAENIYARVIDDSTYLYRTETESEVVSNIYFLLEETYFVEILSTVNTFYKVVYSGIIGYVKIDKVKVINKIPNRPYPQNITFNITNSLNSKIRTSPTTENYDSNVIGIINTLPANLNYIGLINGEETISGLGNKWYYCSFEYSTIGKIVGYVYAPLTTNITSIYPNTETFSDSVEPNEETTPTLPSEKTSTLLIILLCFPALIILLILIIPFKNKTNETSAVIHKPKDKSHNKKDYYEVD